MSDRTTAFDDMDFSDVVSEPSSVAAANKKKKSAFDDMDFSDVVAAPSIAAKPSASGEAGVPMPIKSVGAPLSAAQAITGPDHWLNVIPQGVGAAAAGLAGIGGVAVDTLLNLPRSAAAAVLPKSAYESIYDAPPEVPFTATTELGADIAQSVRAGTEDVFPAPLANKRFNAEVASGDGGFVDAVTAAFNNPFGAAQEMAKQAVTVALGARAIGILPAIGVMEGGAPELAGAAFDAEWKQGIPQQTAAYQELEAAVGPEEARRILRTQRMQRTSQLQAAAGMAAGKLSKAVGGMELEKVLAGQAAKAFGAKEVAKQAVMEMPEEIAVAAAGNIASQQTGNPELDTTKGLGGAAGLGLVMGGGQAATIGGVQAGARKVSELLANLDAKPKAPVDTVDKRTQVTGFKNEGLGATATKPTAESLITQLMTPAEKAKFDKLKDPEQRRAMIQRADEKRAQIAAAMAENAADRDWVSKNDITTHPTFAAIEAAVRGGATSQAKLKEAVPGASRIIHKAAIDHLEKVGVVSAPDAQRRRTVIAPAVPVDAGAIKSNIDSAILPAVQPTSQPAVQDNIVEQKNSVTLPEGGRSLPQEPEVVNTPVPAQTETVQPTAPAVAPAVERAPEPAEAGGATTLPAPTQNAPVAPPAQPQTPSEVVPPVTGLTPETKKRRQAAAKKPAPTPAVVEAPASPALDSAWVTSADPEDVDIWKGTHDAHAKRLGKNPEDTYVGQVLRGITPTVAPTADDGAFAEKMKLRIPESSVATTTAPAAPPAPAEAPLSITKQTTRRSPTEGTSYELQLSDGTVVSLYRDIHQFGASNPQWLVDDPLGTEIGYQGSLGSTKQMAIDNVLAHVARNRANTAKRAGSRDAARVGAEAAAKAPVVPVDANKEAAIAKAQAEVAADKAEKERVAAKIPSDAELAMSGMSPGEIALAKKTKPQEIFDAVSRGEISTPQGMRPVTDADIAAAKTRPDKERLTKLKAKYEQVTDAPRKLPPATITNVRKEAIARAYERIKAMAQSPNMSQFDAIPSDPESTKAILGLQATAQTTATTEAELAKKLEDQYVDNYKRNHPEVAEDFAPAAAGNSRGKKWGGVTNARAALLAMISGRTQASAENVGLANSIKAVPSIQNTNVVVLTAEQAKASDSILRKDNGSIAAGVYDVTTDTVYIAETATSETVLHEVYHAATVKAAAAVEQGTVTTPDAVRALANLKAAVTAISEIDTSALPQDIAAYIAYAGKNVKEALAVLFSRPDVAQAMRDSGVTVPVQVSRTTKTPVKMPLLKAFAHSIAKLLGASGFTQKYAETTETVIENMLLADVILDSGKELEKIDTRSMSSRSLAKGREGIRNTGTDSKRGATDTADFAPAAKPLTDTEKGVGTLNRVADAVIGLARNRGIASQDAQDMIESRHGIMEAMRVEGESAIEQVKQEMVDALRGASNATKEAYKVNVLKYLHGDTTVPLPESLKKRIAELRKLIDDRSLAMIAMGLVPKDKIRTVLENIGKWTHRDFKVFNLEPGRNNHPGEYKKLVMKLAKHGRRDIVKEVVADIVEAMRVPDAATLNALIASAKDTGAKDHEDAVATIDLWKRRWRLHSTLSTKEVHKRLLDISKMDEAELQKHAAEYANYMLNPLHENAPADAKADFNRFKQVYADETALSKDRTQIPKWLKILWGEYTDWETVSVLSLDNQAQILTKFVTMSRYKARLLSQNRAFKSDSNRSKVGYTLLDGKAYGPLNGYYIPDKDLWLIQASTTIDALDVALGARERGGHSLQANLRKIASGVVDVTSTIGAPFKVAQVLASHTTVLINAGVTALILSGAIPNIRGALKAIPNAFKIARASSFADIGIRTSRTGPFKGVGMLGRALENGSELQNQLLFLISHNVLHDAALTADMQRKQHEQLTQEVDAMLDFSARLAKYYANPFHMYRYGKDRLSRLNSAGDEFGKYIMWATRVDGLMAADPSMSEEEAKILAAKHTADTMPSFMKSMPAARVIGNTGLANPFMTFNTEQLRNVYNSLAIAAEFGLKRKGRAAKMYAASELVSTLVRLGGISMYNAIAAGPLLVIMQAATDMLDDDDDEDKKKKEEEQIAAGMAWNTGEKYEAIRAALPSYIHGGVQILRDLGDGKYVLTSGQRFDPAMAGALLEAAMYEGDGAFEDVLVDTFAQLAPTLPGLLNVASGYTNLYTAKEDSDAKVQAADQISLGLSQLAKTYTPGSWKTTERTSKAAEQGVELTTREKILNNIGHTVQVFDSHKAASRIAADYNSVQRDAMRDVKDAMEDKEETLDFHAATLRKLALWERAKSKVDNLKAMGMDFGTVWDAVKNDPISKGINKKELVGLYEGTFPLPDYIEIVGNSRKTALVKAGTKPEEVDALYESYLKQADEAEQQMRAILESQGVTVQ